MYQGDIITFLTMIQRYKIKRKGKEYEIILASDLDKVIDGLIKDFTTPRKKK